MKKKVFAVLTLAFLLAFSMAPAAWATETAGTLYGIVVDGSGGFQGSEANSRLDNNDTIGGGSGSGKDVPYLVIFTQEGKKVTYDINSDVVGTSIDNTVESAMIWLGQPVMYQLNTNGEIIAIRILQNNLFNGIDEIKIKNNSYLVSPQDSYYTLADNAVIFMVNSDDGYVSPELVSRSYLLSGGDFLPEDVMGLRIWNEKYNLQAYAKYVVNAEGAIQVLAYTNASCTDYFYGVIDKWKFTDDNHAGDWGDGTGVGDYAVTLVGDERVYELDNNSARAGSGRFVIYARYGNKLKVVYAFGNNNKLQEYTRKVTGYNNGLITVVNGWQPVEVTGSLSTSQLISMQDVIQSDKQITSIPTDNSTVVYVIDAVTGKYNKGSLNDIYNDAMVYVPVIDKDGFADCVLVDNYSNNTSIPVTGITLDKTALTMEIKTTEQLKATVLPADTTSTISWTSSNEKVATVDNTGKITALTKGTATITAAADGIKAECVVTVTADNVYTITFDTDGGTLATGITNPDYVIKGETYKMPGASKSRYTLTAWAIGGKDSKTQAKANDVYTFTEDTTVYAIWQYNGGGGGSHGGSSRPSGTTKPGTTEKPGNTEKPGTTTGSNTVTAANVNNKFADVQNNDERHGRRQI